MTNDRYYSRAYVIAGLVVLVALIFISRLFYLQVIDQSTIDRAERNALLKQTVYPSRGLISDRNGTLLVYNQPVYDVMLVMREMGKDFDTLAFCKTLSITPDDFISRIEQISDRRKNLGFSRYTPQIFMSQLKKEDISALNEQLFLFPGVSIRKRTLRDYKYPNAAHVLGSVGEVNAKDIETDDYYSAGDYSGRDGIEKQYEKILRGDKGVEVLMRDSKGRIQGSYHNGELDLSPNAGTDITLSIDIRLQALAEQMMQNKIGSIVAIEPSTGEVLTLVSSPAWDPQDLVGRKRSANYAALNADIHKPLMNRAVQAQYSPGSTFKLVQALIGLEMKAINPKSTYPCNGKPSAPIKCTHSHGSPVDLESAIEQSCNPYFWQEFRDLLQMNGYGSSNAAFHRTYDSWREHVLSFGFGNRFSSDIPNQSAGSIPSSKFYDKIYGKTGWKAITIRSLSIGQGEILVTPLQLANEAACIANNGYYITPHLARLTPELLAAAGLDSALYDKHYADISIEHFAVVKAGMERVMTKGTGRHYNIPDLAMCGKTGTVQNPHGKDHAIFIGFAPKDKPKIAVAVVVENAGYGATWACPMATLLMEQYLTDTIARPELFNSMTTANLIAQ